MHSQRAENASAKYAKDSSSKRKEAEERMRKEKHEKNETTVTKWTSERINNLHDQYAINYTYNILCNKSIEIEVKIYY